MARGDVEYTAVHDVGALRSRVYGGDGHGHLCPLPSYGDLADAKKLMIPLSHYGGGQRNTPVRSRRSGLTVSGAMGQMVYGAASSGGRATAF